MNTIPTVTKNLLIINVLMFLGTIVAQSYGIDLAQYLGLHFFLAEDFNAAQLITYMFMHAGFAHIFFNMFAVWMFGRILEQVWGPKRFLFYYLVCGIGAGIIQEVVQYIHYETVLSAYDSVNTGMAIIPMEEYLNMMTTVGASGAVYAILLAFGMLFPNQQMFIFVNNIKREFCRNNILRIFLLQGSSKDFSGLEPVDGIGKFTADRKARGRISQLYHQTMGITFAS